MARSQGAGAAVKLFHATYAARLENILATGLGHDSAPEIGNYEDSKRGVVCLADSVDVAISYAETSDVVPDSWLDQVVVLQVNSAMLDASKLMPDTNVQFEKGEDPSTFEFHGVIAPDLLTLYSPGPKTSP